MICFYSGLINFSPKYFSESGGGEIFINGCRKTLNKWLRKNLTNRNIMDKFQNLFLMVDKLGMVGMLGLWFSFFTTGFVVLLTDDQTGPLRDFSMVSQLVCCTNLAAMGYSVAHNVSLKKSFFYTMNFDTFATLLAFAYFGGGSLLNSTTLGVWNYVQFVFTVANGVWGAATLYVVAKDHKGYTKHLSDSSSDGATVLEA